MATLDFDNKTLERLHRSFKWARNNSLQLWDAAQAYDILSYEPEGMGQHTILYQFQCLVTTTDTYYRRLTRHADTRFGVLVGMHVTPKSELSEDSIKRTLQKQTKDLEDLFRHFSERNLEDTIQDIQSIVNHEYLHQGQLVVMFRSLGKDLPERFRQAFDL